MPSCMKRYCQRQTQVLAGLVHDLIGAEPVCAQQDDLGPPHLLLRHIAIPHDRLQTEAVGRSNDDENSRMRQIRMQVAPRELLRVFKCQI